jgi:hypothetical protein
VPKIALFCSLCWLAACTPAPPPTLSGVWKPLNAPDTPSYTVEHREPELKVRTSHTATYTTDGSETCNVVDGYMVCSKARWDGPMLRIDSTSNQDSVDTVWSERWSLAPDGKSLTIQQHWESSKRRFDRRIDLARAQ